MPSLFDTTVAASLGLFIGLVIGYALAFLLIFITKLVSLSMPKRKYLSKKEPDSALVYLINKRLNNDS